MESLISTITLQPVIDRQYSRKNLLSSVYCDLNGNKYLCFNTDFDMQTFSFICDLASDTQSANYGISKEMLMNLAKLKEISELDDNWDGNGAKSFSRDFINYIKEVVMHLDIQPNIFPLYNGNIQFEAHNGDCSIEIEINENNMVVADIIDENDNEFRKEFENSYKDLNNIIRDFYGHKF